MPATTTSHTSHTSNPATNKQLIQLHPSQLDWLNAQQGRFFQSVAEYAHKHNNSITPRQYKCLPVNVQSNTVPLDQPDLPLSATPTNNPRNSGNSHLQLSDTTHGYILPHWNKVLTKFQTASENGIKKPKINLVDTTADHKFALTFNPQQSTTCIKYNNLFCGSVTTEGKYLHSPKLKVMLDGAQVAVLSNLVTNLEEELQAYGMRTGECSCCGRELTNPTSIALGIGPICADNYGINHEVPALELGGFDE